MRGGGGGGWWCAGVGGCRFGRRWCRLMASTSHFGCTRGLLDLLAPAEVRRAEDGRGGGGSWSYRCECFYVETPCPESTPLIAVTVITPYNHISNYLSSVCMYITVLCTCILPITCLSCMYSVYLAGTQASPMPRLAMHFSRIAISSPRVLPHVSFPHILPHASIPMRELRRDVFRSGETIPQQFTPIVSCPHKVWKDSKNLILYTKR